MVSTRTKKSPSRASHKDVLRLMQTYTKQELQTILTNINSRASKSGTKENIAKRIMSRKTKQSLALIPVGPVRNTTPRKTKDSLKNRTGVKHEINLNRSAKENQRKKQQRRQNNTYASRALMKELAAAVFSEGVDPKSVYDWLDNPKERQIFLQELQKVVNAPRSYANVVRGSK